MLFLIPVLEWFCIGNILWERHLIESVVYMVKSGMSSVYFVFQIDVILMLNCDVLDSDVVYNVANAYWIPGHNNMRLA